MMLSITLPDGSKQDLPKGSTGLDLAKTIGPGLAKSAVAISIDGVQKDLEEKWFYSDMTNSVKDVKFVVRNGDG